MLPLAANALMIDAKLVSFQDSDARLNGAAPAGGIGSFEILSNVTGTAADFLGDSFLAACMEPHEYVTVGNRYRFEFVDLADAPTSVAGGMGPLHAQWIERIMSGFGHASIEDVVAAGPLAVSIIEMALYEAAFEAGDTFDFTGGSARVTGSGGALANAAASHVASPLEGVRAFGLLNVAPISPTRSAFTGQDFMVAVRAEEVVAPGAGLLMTLGLGLLGLTRTKRGKTNV